MILNEKNLQDCKYFRDGEQVEDITVYLVDQWCDDGSYIELSTEQGGIDTISINPDDRTQIGITYLDSDHMDSFPLNTDIEFKVHRTQLIDTI